MNPRWQKLIDELISMGYLKTPRIIEAFKTIDRKDFVLPEYASEAYGNYPLPIGEGQTISQPLTVAFMLELLRPSAGEKILDAGSGSGWVTALLAYIISNPQTNADITPTDAENELRRSAGRVVGVERIPSICEFGIKNLKKYFTEERAKIFCGDATSVVPAEGPFDKIIAGAAAGKNIPELWRKALKTGGVIVAPIGGSIWRFTKKSESEWREEEFPGFAFVPLVTDNQPRTGPAESGTVRGGQPTPNQSSQSSDATGQATDNSQQKKSSVSTGQPIATDKEIEESRRKKRKIYIPIILFAVSLFFSYAAYAMFAPLTLRPQKIQIEIPEGAGARRIGEMLKAQNLVRSKWLFVAWSILTGRSGGLKHGQYRFEAKASVPEIVSKLHEGELYPNERSITIPEGWSISDVARRLEERGVMPADDFFAVVGRPRSFQNNSESILRLEDNFPFLKERPPGANLEGYLFPDTYRFSINAEPEKAIGRMLENFENKITPELRREIERREKTLYQLITVASLIEKEVPHEEDRAVISGILWKRLELNIGLQVDATITYITGKKSTKISREELEIDSPYNTYKYRGLPPGPIANPGLSAIKAAVFPKTSPYLYYLSAPDGKTIFSKTLDEHNLAKAKYLR